jgi:hypothetical protein
VQYLVLIPVGLIIWGAILFPIVASIYGLIKWRGGWRTASAVPLLVVAAFFAPMIPDWVKDSSAHNLWGLLYIPITMLLSAYSGTVVLLHRKRAAEARNSVSEL